MLIASDFKPTDQGSFTVGGARVTASEAFALMGRGAEVVPADPETTERLAERLHAAGNDTRAAMLRRWADGLWGTGHRPAGEQATAALAQADPAPAETPITEPDAGTAETGEPKPDPAVTTSIEAAKAAVDAAGDDAGQLMSLARRAGLTLSPRSKPDKIREQIFAAMAKSVAEGKPPLED